MSRVRTPEAKAEQAARFRDAVFAMLHAGELARADAEELLPLLDSFGPVRGKGGARAASAQLR